MFASTSPHMSRRLPKKCDGQHTQQQLVGGRAAKAAFYPVELVEEILRGIRDTADAEAHQAAGGEDARLAQALAKAGTLQDTPADLPARIHDEGLQHKLDHARVRFNFQDGRSTMLPLQWKEAYKDEYTSEARPTGTSVMLCLAKAAT